jgi:Zn finger protein HypA/HybF involved in hydrogenase expression
MAGCSLCGWNKVHSITKRIPLEIDHIDGNAENNSEENLRLICPNCHSLTPHFRNLNKGKGRKWRTNKYKKN